MGQSTPHPPSHLCPWVGHLLTCSVAKYDSPKDTYKASNIRGAIGVVDKVLTGYYAVMDRDRRLTGSLRGQTNSPIAAAGFELNNPWRVRFSHVALHVPGLEHTDNLYHRWSQGFLRQDIMRRGARTGLKWQEIVEARINIDLNLIRETAFCTAN